MPGNPGPSETPSPTARAKPDIAAIFADGRQIDEALRKVARAARLMHKKLGHPIVVWENDRVVWIPPEEITVEDDLGICRMHGPGHCAD